MKDPKEMLALLGGLGLGGGFVAVLAEFAEVPLDAETRRYLTGPVIVHESAWRDTQPSWMMQLAAAERAEVVFAGKWPIVGPCEIAAVMYPATFVAPLPSELIELYLWASAHACSRHFGQPIEDYWQRLGSRPIADQDVVNKGGRLWHVYYDLAHEIRRKVIAAQTEADRINRRQVRQEDGRPTAPKKPVTAKHEGQQSFRF